MELVALGQLGQDVAESVDAAALTVGLGPQLGDRPDEPGCPVAHHEQRATQTPGGEPSSEVEPVLEALALPEADVEEHALPGGRVGPGHEHALLRSLRAHRQVDGVQEERHQADLGEGAGPEGPVAVTQLATDPADGALADGAEAGLGCEALDVTIGQAPHIGADDERFEGPGADDGLGVGDGRGDEAGEGVTDLGHRHGDLALGGLDAPGPGPVARAGRCLDPFVAGPTEEGGDLLLDRPLDDQLGAETAELG